MRNFLISVICLGVLIGAWAVFDHFSDDTLTGYVSQIDTQILKNVEAGQWARAAGEFDQLSKDWHSYKKKAAFFLDTEAINDTDYSIARAKYYIKAKDKSNSTGELSCLKEQLVFLDYDESLSLGNIF